MVIYVLAKDESLPNRQVPTLSYMYYVYIIKSQNKNFRYVGFTSDLQKRFNHHNTGANKSTAKHRPLKLIYYEAYLSESDARKREKFLKSGRGREVIKKQLENTFDAGIV